jgi:hypothetical protein
MSYLPDEYASRMGIDCEHIASLLRGVAIKVGSGTLVRLYDEPSDWSENNDEVSRVIEQTENMFSKRNVIIPTGLSFRESRSEAADLSGKWP